MHLPRITAIVGLAAALVLATCGSSSSEGDSAGDGPIKVAAAFYPLQEAVERVGGVRVEVTGLTPPGTGPHDLELTPQTAEAIEQADAVVYLSRGFQPAVEKAVSGLPDGSVTLDVLDGTELLPVEPGLKGTRGDVDGEELEDGLDPHVWVDPTRQAEIARNVAAMLTEVGPEHADDYAAGLESYVGDLDALSDDFASGLEECGSRTIVTSHRAFAYLAESYDLKQIAIAGISPE